MPTHKYDSESGALIFTPTSEEREIANVKRYASERNDELLEKLKIISENLESLNKRVSFIEEKLIEYKEER